MITRRCKCALNEKEYNLVKYNPHCTQYFCNFDNVECDEDIKTEKEYKYYLEYSRTFTPKPFTVIPRSLDDFKRSHTFETLEEISALNTKYTYQPRQYMPMTVLHLGQLKLFLSTLQFLLYYAPKDRDVHVVYPGSAPGNNLLYIIDLFPQCIWYLIDPQEQKGFTFNQKLFNHPNVAYIKQDYFTADIIKQIKPMIKNKYTLLISDIRLTTDDTSIDRDNRLNESWIKKLKPDYAQVKWRIPFDDTGEKYRFYDGQIYLQMYAPISTTETRLVIDCKKLKRKTYNNKKYEGDMYYFNHVLRCSYYSTNVKTECTDHCHDCVAFINLIKLYKERYSENIESKKSIKDMIITILKNIKSDTFKYTEEDRLCKKFKSIKLHAV